jgi:uncharacterized membrane protein
MNDLKTVVHANYLRASNLIIVGIALGFLNYFISHTVYTSYLLALNAVIIIVDGIIAYLVRKGNVQIKWILLAITIISIPSTINYILHNFQQHDMLPISIRLAIQILHVIALILLFAAPKSPNLQPVV